jgi:protein Mpv17
MKNYKMYYLSNELQNKIIFPKYYKCIQTNLTLNEKIIIGHNFSKLKMVTEQLNSLHDEYVYRNRKSNNTNNCFFRFVLMKNLCKKKIKYPKNYKTHTNNTNNTNNLNILNNFIYTNNYTNNVNNYTNNVNNYTNNVNNYINICNNNTIFLN